MRSEPPPQPVLAAFGAAGVRLVPLGGGQTTSWHAGGLVLKPADLDRAELEWQAQVCSQLSCDGFRLAQPRTAVDGSLCVDGWCATEYLTGQHHQRRWPEIIAVGERFHAALRGIPRPGFLDHRASPWATSDRVAWGEIPADDFSPYWRPAAYASAIVVADALVWEGADARILDAVTHIDNFGQYLIRALIFRAVTDWILAKDAPAASGAGYGPWAPAVVLACQLAARA